MMFADRAVGGLLAVTIPLYLATAIGFDPPMVGRLVGVAMLAMALGAWPAGRLVDRFGVFRVRLVAGLVYACGFAFIPMAVESSVGVASLVFAMTGIGGAALFASSLVLVCQRCSDSRAMGAYHAAGNLGFFVGPLGAAVMLRIVGGNAPDAWAFGLVLISFGAAHMAIGILGLVGLLREPKEPTTRADMSEGTHLA